jgi:3-hydroxyisobutyrate dehydrogenase
VVERFKISLTKIRWKLGVVYPPVVLICIIDGMRRIGIMGAGIMAAGMAQNFLKHGYSVTMWNRTPEHLEPLLKAGAKKAATPKAACEAADLVIECVTNDEASRSVWLGETGILAGASQDTILAASSSLSIEWTDELAALCKQKGLQFMDMPLTGSRSGAENGTLRLLIGAEEPVFNAIHDDLRAIAEKIYRFGVPGSGMRFKLLLNSLIAIHMNAAGQAQLLAKRAGIDPQLFAHALMDGTMGPASPATKLVFDSANWDKDHVNFALQWMEKDLRYARDMASLYEFDFDLLNDTQADYTRAKDDGLGASDVTAIARSFQ